MFRKFLKMGPWIPVAFYRTISVYFGRRRAAFCDWMLPRSGLQVDMFFLLGIRKGVCIYGFESVRIVLLYGYWDSRVCTISVWQCPIKKSAVSKEITRGTKSFRATTRMPIYVNKKNTRVEQGGCSDSTHVGQRLLLSLIGSPCKKSPRFGVPSGHGWAWGRIYGITWRVMELLAFYLELFLSFVRAAR